MRAETPKVCSAPACQNVALSWSEPPLCFEHVPDIDGWYAGVHEKLMIEPAQNVRTLYGLLAHSEYMAAISNNSVAEELYKDFEPGQNSRKRLLSRWSILLRHSRTSLLLQPRVAF